LSSGRRQSLSASGLSLVYTPEAKGCTRCIVYDCISTPCEWVGQGSLVAQQEANQQSRLGRMRGRTVRQIAVNADRPTFSPAREGPAPAFDREPHPFEGEQRAQLHHWTQRHRSCQCGSTSYPPKPCSRLSEPRHRDSNSWQHRWGF
jgi:hypothetical protein